MVAFFGSNITKPWPRAKKRVGRNKSSKAIGLGRKRVRTEPLHCGNADDIMSASSYVQIS
jgi:hypothetical protein